jgi:hypothetical protein
MNYASQHKDLNYDDIVVIPKFKDGMYSGSYTIDCKSLSFSKDAEIFNKLSSLIMIGVEHLLKHSKMSGK